MTNNKVLKMGIKLALGVGTAAAVLSTLPVALAQKSEAVDALEEITVTGSRIKRADLESASPVTVIDREAILSQGITDVGNLLQRMPSMSGTPLGSTTNNGNTNEGVVQIDLRGMGPARTLTLVNGKRTVDGGDYTTIPAVMIERVEILKDGASAIYGADAVAGVVNIITRTDFEGLSINAQNAGWFDTDNAVQNSVSLIAGQTFDGGNLVFGAEYIDQDLALQGDTPWEFLKGSYYVYFESDIGCEVDPANRCTFFGSSRIPESRLSFPNHGIFMIPQPGAVMTPYDGRTFNYAPDNYLQTPYKRINYFAEGNYDLSESVRFKAAFRGSNRNSDQQLAPLPYDSNIDPAYNGVFNGAPYTGLSENNYYLMEAIDAYNSASGTALAYEPLTNVRRRMVETPRQFRQDLTQYQVNLGFEGTLTNGIDWDLYYNSGKRSIVSTDLGQFSGVRLADAMGPSADLDGDGSPECYGDISDPTSIVSGCVPLNFFGGEGSLTQEMIDYVGVQLVDSRVSNQEVFSASITGTGFKLPAGDFGWAVGASYRAEDFNYTPDSAKAIGAVTGGTGAGTDGSLYSNSIYVEGLAPLFDNGIQSLAIKAGARWDDYNLFGNDTTWQLGVEFQAIDSLKLRATAGTAFRAPTISELFDGLQTDAPTYSDPCDPEDFELNYGGNGTNIAPGCAQTANRTDTQTTSLTGGNLALMPETADTMTAGIVFTPDVGDSDLSITLDWWRIELEDAISSYGVQFTLDQCYVEQIAASCDLITRRSDADYTIRDIVDSNVNLATQKGEGVDLEVRYRFDTNIGELETALLWGHLIERSKVARPGAPEQNLTGLHTSITAEDGGTYAENTANFSVHLNRNDLTIGYLAEFISAIDAPVTFQDYTQKIDSYLYHDLVVDYRLERAGETTITVGVTNLSDEPAPYIDAGFNATTDPNTYRMFGRGYFVRVSHEF